VPTPRVLRPRFDQFAAKQQRLLMGMNIPRQHLEKERQAYVVKWAKEAHKKIVRTLALASADSRSGYVLSCV